MADLLSTFHSLGGNTISEHKKLFNKFLQEDVKSAREEHLRLFLKKMTPKSRQEENFRVIINLKHGSPEDIIQLLMEGDKISTRLLLMHCNVSKLFKNISGDYFVHDICPNLSYVTRNSIVNKLAVSIENDAQGESFYTAVYEKYGLKTATPLLIACSEYFIRNTISNYRIRLSERQLIYLHKKDPSLLVHYMKFDSKRDAQTFQSQSLLARYLSTNDVHTFKKLLNYGEPTIGKSGARNYLRRYKQVLLKQCEEHKFIKGKYMKSCWTLDDCKLYFRNSFPKSVYDFRVDALEEVLKSFRQKERLQILYSTFKNVYGYDMEPKKYYMVPYLFSQADQRTLMDDIDEYDLKIIREKINITSDMWARRDLLIKLLKTCEIYEDLTSLLHVLQYFQNRHRNEDIAVREKFLDTIAGNFDLTLFTDAHWNAIDDIVTSTKIVGHSCNEIDFCLARVHIKLIRNMDFTEELKRYLKVADLHRSWNVLTEKPKFHKAILLQSFKIAPSLFPKETDSLAVRVIDSITEWNSKNRHDKISYYQYPQYIKSFFKQEQDNESNNYKPSATIKKILLYNPESPKEKESREQLLQTYLKNYPRTFDDQMYIWFLENRASDLVNHIELIKNPDFEFYYVVSKMRYHPIYHKFKKHMKNVAPSSALKFLVFEDNFIEKVVEHKPQYDEMIVPELWSIGENENFSLMVNVLQCVKHRSKPEEFLNILLEFCRRDYLRFVLETLYHSLFHSRESAIKGPILQLVDKAVSIRKHAIFLATSIGSRDFGRDLLTKYTESEKNISVRQFVLKRTFQTFVREGSTEYFDLLKLQVDTLAANDYESTMLLKNIKAIPEKFLSQYIPLIWEYLEKCVDNEHDFQYVLNELSSAIVNSLPNDFCKKVLYQITRNKFSSMYSSDKFVYHYLISQHGYLENRMGFASRIISEHSPSLYEMYQFTEFICYSLIDERPDVKVSFLKLFKFFFNNPQLLYDKFELHLLVDATILFLGLPTDDYQGLTNIIIQLQSYLIGKFGLAALDYHIKFTLSFLDKVFWKFSGDHNDNYVTLAECMILNAPTDAIQLLILGLLPSACINDEKYKSRCRALIDKIHKNASPTVNIYVMNLLKNIP